MAAARGYVEETGSSRLRQKKTFKWTRLSHQSKVEMKKKKDTLRPEKKRKIRKGTGEGGEGAPDRNRTRSPNCTNLETIFGRAHATVRVQGGLQGGGEKSSEDTMERDRGERRSAKEEFGLGGGYQEGRSGGGTRKKVKKGHNL